MLLITLMFGFFAAWFFYDWKFKYPEQKFIYDEYVRVMAEPDGEKRWLEHSGPRGWPLEPDKRTQDEIDTQLQFAIGCGLITAVVLGFFLFNRGKVLRADAEAYYPPGGGRVPFTSAFRIDRRKWRHKGLAVVHYRDEKGAERRTVIDDLKYGGAEKILDRFLSRFEGELIDVEEKGAASPADGAGARTEETSAG